MKNKVLDEVMEKLEEFNGVIEKLKIFKAYWPESTAANVLNKIEKMKNEYIIEHSCIHCGEMVLEDIDMCQACRTIDDEERRNKHG